MGPLRALVVAAVAIVALPPVTAAQGLGDASKKEKTRREQGQTTKAKSYTQEDLATLPPVANEPASTTGEATLPAPSLPNPSRGEGAPPSATGEPIFREETPSDPQGSGRGDERSWRGRVAQARARVDRARQRHQTLAGLSLVPATSTRTRRADRHQLGRAARE
jgi:type IV secretory pathway VirB10-like protein